MSDRDADSHKESGRSHRSLTGSPGRPRQQRTTSRDRRKEVSRQRSKSPRRKESRRSRSRDRQQSENNYRAKQDRHDHRRHDDRKQESYGSRLKRSRSYLRSPPRRRYDDDHAVVPTKRSKGPLSSQKDAFSNDNSTLANRSPSPEKQKPNFGNTGRLAAASNTVKGSGGKSIILKYHEPPEARKPSPRNAWRMYVFKESEIIDTVELAEQSCWLFGRETAVVDYPVEHPSSSKQHAVIQFRYIEKRNEYGDKKGKVKPYVIDLESANGTKVNGESVPAGRYVELRDNDALTFGHSTREYVVQLPPTG